VQSVAFSPDGRLLAAATGEPGIDRPARAFLWNLATGKPAAPVLPHAGCVLSLAFSADGRFLATGSRDRAARVWEVASGEPVTPPLRHDGAVRLVSFVASLPGSPRRLLTATGDSAQLWDLPRFERGAAELDRLAGLLSARHLDDSHGLAILPASAWLALSGVTPAPDPFGPAPSSSWPWTEAARK
jgi:WD40 repeat protein